MENGVTLDVIIPSFRIDNDALNRILQLPHSPALHVTFCIVMDNPNAATALSLTATPSAEVLIVKNTANLGAPMSRNVGTAATHSDWILFLDDDIVPQDDTLFAFEQFIEKHGSDYMGAIGLTKFPVTVNSFTRGIRASDILTFFEIAEWYRTLKWGVTANVLIKRSAIGEQRFSSDFPKNGGGEDIDFFLRCGPKNGRKFLCLSEAKVHHDWWYGGQRAYMRFFRWAFGDSLLPGRFPEYRFWNFPNIAEMMFLWVLAMPVCLYARLPFVALAPLAFLLADVAVENIKLIARKRIWNPIIALEVSLIRGANDCGRCFGNLSRGRVWFVGERFDYFCDGKHIQHERFWAFWKAVAYAVSLCLLLRIH